MEVREIDLPGVGKKYALVTGEGERVTLILHTTGHREVYLFEKGGEFPKAAVRLDDEEARQLGAILGGAFFHTVGEADLRTVLGQLTLDWLDAGASVGGRTIGELRIRTVTGASVLAILREGELAVANPGPEDTIQRGDRLVVIGTRDQVDALRGFAE